MTDLIKIKSQIARSAAARRIESGEDVIAIFRDGRGGYTLSIMGSQHDSELDHPGRVIHWLVAQAWAVAKRDPRTPRIILNLTDSICEYLEQVRTLGLGQRYPQDIHDFDPEIEDDREDPDDDEF